MSDHDFYGNPTNRGRAVPLWLFAFSMLVNAALLILTFLQGRLIQTQYDLIKWLTGIN